MYTKGKNGERVEVNLHMMDMRMPAPPMIKETYEKSEGSNKMLLYIALVFGIAVVIGSAYMLYRDDKKNTKKNAFGYSLV